MPANTIFRAELTNYSTLCKEHPPIKVAQMLKDLQGDMDKIYEEEKVHKVYFTEGAYLVEGKHF